MQKRDTKKAFASPAKSSLVNILITKADVSDIFAIFTMGTTFPLEKIKGRPLEKGVLISHDRNQTRVKAGQHRRMFALIDYIHTEFHTKKCL